MRLAEYEALVAELRLSACSPPDFDAILARRPGCAARGCGNEEPAHTTVPLWAPARLRPVRSLQMR